MKATFVIAFFTSLFLSHIALAQVFVKPGAAGNNDGTSWQNAYTNLDTALSRASTGQISALVRGTRNEIIHNRHCIRVPRTQA